MNTLTVELGARAYPIIIGDDLAATVRADVDAVRGQARPVAVVTDANLAAVQGSFLDAAFGDASRLVLPAGEKTKSTRHLADLWDFLAANRIDRTGRLYVAGGGVIGDLGGFAAASYLRGITFCQVPTTLLAAVDSSVGGKTGINITAGKNLVGAFAQPEAVFVDTGVLATLPPREFSAGMAEVIKYGLLADTELFSHLESVGRLDPDHPELAAVIRRCCEIKADVVRADEKEQAASGGRALLNLGHTFAHAIEAVAGYGDYVHGEAVAVGLVMAARLSEALGLTDAAVTDRTRVLLEAYALPVRLREPLAMEALLAAMKRDKKVKHGRLRFVAMEALGRAITVESVEEMIVVDLWREFGADG